MITPVQLSYFFALLKHKNFQRAASACHVTQPTLSMQLKKVEEIMGFVLINRDTHPISLTSNGKKILPLLLKIQDTYDDLDIQTQKIRGNYKAEVRIGIIPTISNYLVPELYAKWDNQIGSVYLDITEMTSEKLLEAIIKKEIDFGIMAGPIENINFRQQILYNEPIYIYAPTIKEKLISLQQLENKQPWLLSPGNCLRTQMINFCNLNSTNVHRWNYEGGNLNVLIKMVEQEGGYTLIPAHYLPYLSIKEKHIKKIKDRNPVRKIIGLHLQRNTKKEEITQIMHIIQQEKNQSKNDYLRQEVLPWST